MPQRGKGVKRCGAGRAFCFQQWEVSDEQSRGYSAGRVMWSVPASTVLPRRESLDAHGTAEAGYESHEKAMAAKKGNRSAR
jgi:hypothetical protein